MAIISAVLLTACGAEDGGADEGGSAAAAGFPVTVDTAFGPVTVADEPQRVVALGWGDAETALALGVQPVAASDWLDFGGDGVGPWAAGRYDEAPELIDTLEPSYEAIAALQPDLILDVRSSGDLDRHDTLAAIAPTIGIPEGAESYQTDSRAQMEMIAAALGREDLGDQLLAEVEQAFADAAAQHPEWAGRTATVGSRTSDGWGAYVARGEDDDLGSRVAFMAGLGFVQNPQIADLPVGSSGFSVPVSEERLDLLDADVVIVSPIYVEPGLITEDPLWQAVPAVADGRALVLDGDVASAFSLGTTLAIRYAIDELVPRLADLPVT